MGAFLRNSFAHVDNVIPVVKTINHMAAHVKVARQQTPPELSGTFRTLPPEPTPTRAGTLRNPPEPSGTCLRNLPFYTGTLRNLTGTCLRNLHQQTPELSGTFRNLPEPSGTFRNLPPEPAPATRTGTHRSLSGLKTPLACAVGELWKEKTNPITIQMS